MVYFSQVLNCLISRTAIYVIRMSGGVRGTLREGRSYLNPIERQVFDAQQAGVNLYCPTVFGGLKNIYETYLEPLYKELIFELQKGKRWHADETRWYMLCDQTKKLWYMWGFKTEKITAFVLDATRAAQVPAKTLLGIDDINSIKEPVQIPEEKKKILTVDRYSASLVSGY